MLYISTTQSTAVYVTLYEGCINKYNPYFIWRIINQDTYDETIFYQDDVSLTPWTYNQFTISVANPEGLTAGIIDVKSGQYVYEVYETNTRYSLDINNAVKMVETGILNIIGTSSVTKTYVGNNNSIPTYQNLN